MNSSVAPKATTRREQRDQTRALILQTAVKVLVESGVARTTTLEVQRRAGISRGALLHHFPTHAELLAQTVQELVRMNEQSIWQEAARTASTDDPLGHAIRTLTSVYSYPSFVAELELWAVARTDIPLRDALRGAEREALKESKRVTAKLFWIIRDHPKYTTIVNLTIEFARGLALSGILQKAATRRQQRIEDWVKVVKLMVETAP